MQPERFDHVARHLAAGITRRQVVASIAGIVATGSRIVGAADRRSAAAAPTIPFDCDAAFASLSVPSDASTCDPDACFAAGGCCDPVAGCCSRDRPNDPTCSGPISGFCGISFDLPPCMICVPLADDPRICVHQCCGCWPGETNGSPDADGVLCTILQFDRRNCGACGHACAKHERCTDGQCARCPRRHRRRCLNR